MKYVVLVLSKYVWKTREAKHKEIVALMKTGGIDAILTFIKKDLGVPIVTNGRIDPQWYEEHITKVYTGYNHIIFQFSERDGKKWGVESGLRGGNLKDIDIIGESWVCSDERSVVKFKDGSSRNKYTKTVPHEIGHELKNKDITELEIHDYDYKNEINNIEGFYKALTSMKWSKYLPEPHFSNITQGFAVPNPLYKVSGHHLGVDHGVSRKDNIPVYMPCDGRVTRVLNNDKVLGNCAIILSQDEQWAFRMAHMRDTPKVGTYSAGDQIGIVGTTGLSTGLHLHIDAWRNGIIKVDKIINRDSILQYCVDAHELILKNI